MLSGKKSGLSTRIFHRSRNAGRNHTVIYLFEFVLFRLCKLIEIDLLSQVLIKIDLPRYGNFDLFLS